MYDIVHTIPIYHIGGIICQHGRTPFTPKERFLPTANFLGKEIIDLVVQISTE